MLAEGCTPRTVLVTGGAGFIGANFIAWLLQHQHGVSVVNLDSLTYAGNTESLAHVEAYHGDHGDGRYHFVRGDIRDEQLVASILAGDAANAHPGRRFPRPDAVVHLAAQTHVDRSIVEPVPFVLTNIVGTHVLLECLRRELAARPRPFRFVHVSTDEVYGSLGPVDPPSTERALLQPNNAYAASKAGADLLVRAYRETHSLPCLTTRSSNNYGPLQFPEKLIPLMITRALEGLPLPLYGDGGQVRDWIHVRDHAAALWLVLTEGRLEDETYNISGREEMTNLELVTRLLGELGKPVSLIRHVEDRPGHDRRYVLDDSRIARNLGWAPAIPFDQGLAETVRWYRENRDWWERVRGEAYLTAERYLKGR